MTGFGLDVLAVEAFACHRECMDPLGDLLASDHRQTLEFFIFGLRDVSELSVDQKNYV